MKDNLYHSDIMKFVSYLGDAKKIESLVQMSWTFVNDR